VRKSLERTARVRTPNCTINSEIAIKKPLLKSVLSLVAIAALAGASQAETYAVMVGFSDYPDAVDANGNRLKDENGELVNNDLAGPVNDVKS